MMMPKPGAAVAVQPFGDFQNFHPHLHVLATDGCFYNDSAFMVCPSPDTGELEKLFRYEVVKMLKAENNFLYRGRAARQKNTNAPGFMEC